MNKKLAKSIVASLMAVSMVTPTAAKIVPLNVVAANATIKTNVNDVLRNAES